MRKAKKKTKKKTRISDRTGTAQSGAVPALSLMVQSCAELGGKRVYRLLRDSTKESPPSPYTSSYKSVHFPHKKCKGAPIWGAPLLDPNMCFRTAGKRLDSKIIPQYMLYVNEEFADTTGFFVGSITTQLERRFFQGLWKIA